MPGSERIERFKQMVLRMEQMRDPEQLIALFANNAAIDVPARKQCLIGKAGATEFWNDYLESFQTIRSRFTRESVLNDTAVLEWVSEGSLLTGRPIEYRGVSIIGFTNKHIATFTSYYDSAAFLVDPATVADAGHGTNNEGGD